MSSMIQNVVRWIGGRLPILVIIGALLLLFLTFFQAPEISFTVDSSDIAAGEPVRLRWALKHATFFTVENSNIKGQRIDFFKQLEETRDNGLVMERPEATTRYVFRAQNVLGLASTDDQTVHVREAPRIAEFTTNPPIIQREGDPVEISWKVNAEPGHKLATILTAIVPREDAVPRVLQVGELKGVIIDHPSENETVYELFVSDAWNNGEGENTDGMERLVSLAPAQLDTLTVTPPEVVQCGLTTLRWTGQRFTSLKVRAGADENDASQPWQDIDPTIVELELHPEQDTWYTLVASNLAGSSTRRLKVDVLPEVVPPPKLDFFLATPASIEEGGTAALTFSAQNAESILLRDASGRVIVQRNVVDQPSVMQTMNIAPDQTSVYALTIVNAGGQVTQAVTVTVRPPPEPTPTPGPARSPQDDSGTGNSTVTASSV